MTIVVDSHVASDIVSQDGVLLGNLEFTRTVCAKASRLDWDHEVISQVEGKHLIAPVFC